MEYSYKKIEQKIGQAIKSFREKDFLLLQLNSSERSIAHKLACYLKVEFKEYDVDCEYNKNRDMPKMIIRFWDKCKDIVLRKKEAYPDIVVHKRGVNDNNLLVIELKKSSNRSQKERDFDLIKLKAYMTEGDDYQYQYGMFIDFFVKNDFQKEPTKKIYRNWKEISLESKYFGKI